MLAQKKMTYALPGKKLRYADFLVSSEGAELCEERAETLRNCPEPSNRKELAAWMGLEAQCSQWFLDINAGSKEMRKLSKKEVPFVWSELLSKEFHALKRVLCSKVI